MLARPLSITLLSACLLFTACVEEQVPPSTKANPAEAAAPEHQHDHAAHDHEHLFTTRSGAKLVPLPKEEGVFHFVVYGDRTGGVPAGLKVLEQAVDDTNLLDPDLVMTVGDLVQGYNKTPEWLDQAKEFQAIMDQLHMPWYPVAGNHDVYWEQRDPNKPRGQHEASYEKHFGPLWYAFRHKNAGFIVLYSDEGDPKTGDKGFHRPQLQTMSQEQLQFLEQALEYQKDQDHVFVFLHHPRWLGNNYGNSWEQVHKKLVAAGNVSTVFAGHIHRMRFDGDRDGIEYYTLATTGGHLSADLPEVGYLHHYNVVTVREDSVTMATLPVGAVIDPKKFTAEFLDEIQAARRARPKALGQPLALELDGSVSGEFGLEFTNPVQRPIEVTVVPEVHAGWTVIPDHAHVTIEPEAANSLSFRFQRQATSSDASVGDLDFRAPQLRATIEYIGDKARIKLPDARLAVPLTLGEVPQDFFTAGENRCLVLAGDEDCVRIDSASYDLPQGPFTLEAWVQPANHTDSQAIVAKTQSSEFALFMNDGLPRFDVHLGRRYVTAESKQKLPTDRWTHVAGVYDGTAVKIYIDGKLAGSAAGSGERTTNELPLYLGADPTTDGSPTRAFRGKLDEVRLSSGARYQDSFIPSQRHPTDDQTVLLLHLDRTAGPFVIDQSQPRAAGMRMGQAKLETK